MGSLLTRLFPLLLTATAAYGHGPIVEIIEPERGWWYNPSEPGYGFNIELQNDQLLVGLFIYDAERRPTWYNAFGLYDNVQGTFSGPLIAFSGGPCVGCDYSAANATEASPGTLELTFQNAVTGSATLSGRTFTITRFDPLLQGAGPFSALQGAWLIYFPDDLNRAFTGDVVLLSDLVSSSEGTFLTGTRLFYDNPAVAGEAAQFSPPDVVEPERNPLAIEVEQDSSSSWLYFFSQSAPNVISGLHFKRDVNGTITSTIQSFVGIKIIQNSAPMH